MTHTMNLHWTPTPGQPGIETDLHLPDGRTLHVYDTPSADQNNLTVIWHHGTPNLGRPPVPLFEAAKRLGVRWVGFDRPSYGTSTPVPDRSVGSMAQDVAFIADQLGIQHFAVMGHSGGGPHALACAALLPERVKAAVSLAGLAPYGAEGLDWFAGMHSPESLQASVAGRKAKEAFQASPPEWDPEVFTGADFEALNGAWSWINSVVEPALAAGPEGLIDDDLAYVNPWGFDPAQIQVPVLLVHGEEDRMVPASHSQWLTRHIAAAELWLRPEEGHISVLNQAEAALEWLSKAASR
ncbi:alpha/beta fold hydrolase [Deinococcus roseus]|uniref:Alpha/beta hydrolase n=1 Tax=Deinococcus roseus TaxID=392414 RepID=A0ABQ2DE35_9DEIO|nr:alpha/beta hydrolase [Deinococcus roseus]GGJ52463.1 alpha/beta hydrolase [Deinococcus roseus]